LVTSCASQPAASQRVAEVTAPVETSMQMLPEILNSPTAVSEATATARPSQAPSASPTVRTTPTETPLPPLELPTPLDNPPALQAWDGEPTYPGDSKTGYFFRVKYDPEIWALTTDSYGYPAIGHRGIEYCVIAPAIGHGLPANMNVDHDVRRIGAVEYEINTAYLSGVRQFVTYLGGDTNIYTGFEVTFDTEPDLCLKEAEVVLGTLTSVQITKATPLP